MKKILVIILFFSSLFSLIGCQSKDEIKENKSDVYYEIFVGSFKDSNGDGMGDLNGITESLSFLNDLGIGGLWLTPINESSTYHKYDCDDYYTIDEDFGVMEDLQTLVEEAQNQNIDIILDLVLNHTSIYHEWFLNAKEELKAGLEESEWEYANYYNFTTTYESGYTQLWGTDYYYESRFWSGMPDLNLDNPAVVDEIYEIIDFYFDMGIKGFRLDATMHYFNEDHTRNIEFLAKLNEYILSVNPEAFMVQEVWTAGGTVASYFESGIPAFNFQLSDTTGYFADSVRYSDASKLSSIVESYNATIKEQDANNIDRIFLTNHDQGRAAGFFGSTNDKTKLLANVLLTSPGYAFIYYGEELGMRGTGDDENKRLGYYWSSEDTSKNCLDPNNSNFSQIDGFKGYEEQVIDETSMFNHYKALIELRNKYYTMTYGNVTKTENDLGLYILNYTGEQEFTVITNLTDSDVVYDISGYSVLDRLAITTLGSVSGNNLTIAPYELVFIGK